MPLMPDIDKVLRRNFGKSTDPITLQNVLEANDIDEIEDLLSDISRHALSLHSREYFKSVTSRAPDLKASVISSMWEVLKVKHE